MSYTSLGNISDVLAVLCRAIFRSAGVPGSDIVQFPMEKSTAKRSCKRYSGFSSDLGPAVYSSSAGVKKSICGKISDSIRLFHQIASLA
jgi:hypothetical protein